MGWGGAEDRVNPPGSGGVGGARSRVIGSQGGPQVQRDGGQE